jgi:hypothetical protein
MFLHVGHPLWWEEGSVVCIAITHWLELCWAHNHILLSPLRLSPPGGPGSHNYVPQEQSGQIIPRALGSIFLASYNLQGYSEGILTHLHMGISFILTHVSHQVKSSQVILRPMVIGQSVLVSGIHLGPPRPFPTMSLIPVCIHDVMETRLPLCCFSTCNHVTV